MKKVTIAVIGAGCRGMYAYTPYLLENPELGEVVAVAKKYNNQIFMICHVLRYTPFFSELKRIIDSKELGELVSIQHNENIGYWHFAHSYTRGNWRNSNETSPLILAKSCHDLDILLWLTGSKCKYISSFGSLSHMKVESFKEHMSDKCVDCELNNTCPYSANKIYLEDDKIVGSLNAIHSNPTKENLKKSIKDGPYGRCVYKCDNNVIDHMVSILEFENKVSATFNLSAFTEECTRTIKLMFTHGEVGGNHMKNIVETYKFGDNTHRVIYPKLNKSGHGGGDYSLMNDFISLITSDDGELKTDAIKSVESHIMAFAAEYSRLNYKVVNMDEFYKMLKMIQLE